MAILDGLRKVHAQWSSLLNQLQPVVLLVLRLYWGVSFAQAGWGKFMNWERTVGFFTSLGLPMPELNVAMASGTELVGGICLALGLGGRVMTIPLIFTMFVAYATAHFDVLSTIFSNPSGFIEAPPFLFLLVSVLVLIFGPGRFSLDALIGLERAPNSKS